ncbi:MAG: DUF1622 domain-containing protein [Cyanobacteria bacterium J06638_28]
MEWIEHFEVSLATFVAFAQLILECISVFCVLTGLVKTLQLAIGLNRHHRTQETYPFNQIRIRFGTWLALALEFQLGADVLATTVAPTLEALGKLAIVAIIRTFLNYFLSKELEAEMELENRKRENPFLSPSPNFE